MFRFLIKSVLNYEFPYLLTNIASFFIVTAIVIDLSYQIKFHRQVNFYQIDRTNQSELFCDNCTKPVREDDEYRINCGAAFSEKKKCINHSNRSAKYNCIVCGVPLCGECSVTSNGSALCEKHSFIELREGWGKVHIATTFIEAQLVEQALENKGVEGKIFSNVMGSQVGAPTLWQIIPIIPFMVARWLGGGEIKVFVPARNFEKSEKIISKQIDR